MIKKTVVVSLMIAAGLYPGCIFPQAVSLEYSTYLGGSGWDRGYGLALDSSGCAYLVGVTLSTDFPLSNPYQSSYDGGGDVFITKFSSAGDVLLYSTYLGGSNSDSGWGIAVGNDLCAYVGGITGSNDFPTVNPFQASRMGSGSVPDAFMTKLDSSGLALVYSTYLGGSSGEMNGGGEGNCGVAVDSEGQAYLAGQTVSNDFPTENAFQGRRTGTGSDVFLSKFSTSGSVLVYSTYLGGSSNDQGWALALDPAGRAYLTGMTSSTDFPTRDPYQSDFRGSDGEGDAFVSVFNADGSTLAYSTYLGGGGWDKGYGIAVDDAGRAYVTGFTESTDFPLLNACQGTVAGGEDIFLTGFSASGSTLILSTYYGGNDDDEGWAVALGDDEGISVTGVTNSSDFPTAHPYQAAYRGAGDAFISRFALAGSCPIYSSYLGGGGVDRGWALSAGLNGSVHLAGSTASADFPTANGYQATLAGDNDAFYAKILYLTPSPTATGTGTPTPTPTPTAVKTPSPSPSATPTPRPSPSPGVSASPTPVGGMTPSPSPSAMPTLTPSPTVIKTPSPSPSATPTPSPTPSSGVSPVPTASPLLRLPWIHDYNGDGTSDIAIFRGAAGLWAIRGVTRVYFGSGGDETVPGDYNGDATTEPAIFRGVAGLWAVRGVTRMYFGGGIDRPGSGGLQ